MAASKATETFCALPFKHLCLGVEGTARMCCVTTEFVTEHGAPMSLNTHSLEQIWNSAHMRTIRRKMLNNEPISACAVCYESEAASGHSYRTLVGTNPVEDEFVVPKDVQHYGSKTAFAVDRAPEFIKLEVSNLCNIKCRMCYAGASSQIERDPVAGPWSGGVEPMHALWRGNVARIGPEPRIGVRTSGFISSMQPGQQGERWTDGHAIFDVPLSSGAKLLHLNVAFAKEGALQQRFQIIVNGVPLIKSVLGPDNLNITLDIDAFNGADRLTIEILSDRIIPIAGEGERGLPLKELSLERAFAPMHGASPLEVLHSKYPSQTPWYLNDDIVFRQILKSSSKLRRLYITGGEPLIQQRVHEILDYLVKSGKAKDIHLELSTNCTHLTESAIDLLRQFGKAVMLLSLDGVGETYEYIRFPARWRVVDSNVRKLLSEGISCMAVPVIQVYNILRLEELYDYCDSLGVPLLENVLHEPRRLAIHNLPPRVRKAAANKLLHHLEKGGGSKSPSRVALARYLGELKTDPEEYIVRELMVFTNDLDVSRGQSIKDTLPDLVQLYAEDGFEWRSETRHAKSQTRQVPARQRDYAWL